MKDLVGDRLVLWTSKIRKCVDRLLEMRIYRIGNAVIQQLFGDPIGGPISGVILDACCAKSELMFDSVLWPRIAASCNLVGERADFIAAGRYADDVILVR